MFQVMRYLKLLLNFFLCCYYNAYYYLSILSLSSFNLEKKKLFH